MKLLNCKKFDGFGYIAVIGFETREGPQKGEMGDEKVEG